MSEFRPLPERDAWPTIRGYVYQVDHSIVRWLDLQPNEILELERGEDIDLVLPGLAEGDEELLRRVEQVKHRDVALTLRSPEALAALANYHTYRTADPTARLSFCFTTNAVAGREKPSPMPNRAPALELWNALRTGDVTTAHQPAVLRGIRQIVTSANRPDDTALERWKAATDYFAVATDDEALRFIGAFEWSLGAGKATDLGPQIRERLLADGAVPHAAAAQSIYERLFLFVFTTLTQRGMKRLTREALIAQLAQPPLSEDELRLLSALTIRMRDIERRVAALEGTVAEQSAIISQVSTALEKLVRVDGQLGQIRYTRDTPLLDIPPLIEPRSERANTVDQLVELAAKGSWLAISGSVGMGKTQLSALLTQRLAVRTIWLTLRGLPLDDAGEQLDAGLVAATGVPSSSSHAKWYRQVAEALGSGSLIVLDDLPRFAPADGLGKRLTLFARACAEGQLHLLTTSVYPLSASIRGLLSAVRLRELTVPPFTDAEAMELLRAYAAPGRLLTKKPVNFLNTIARGHPTLLDALARFLVARNWQVSDEAFEELIKRTFASEVDDETMRYLLATVEDATSRELLYRLTLIPHPFVLDDAQALAAVPTIVPRPRERLDALGGLWIQRDIGQQYVVSPLVATFGASELTPETTQGCHRILGERIVVQRRMTPLQITEAMAHFQAAQEFDRLGALFAWSLSELNAQEPPRPDYGLYSAWEDGPMPTGISLGLRIYTRALQVAGRIQRRMPVDSVLSNLDALVEQATAAEAWAVIAVTVVTGGLLDADRAMRFLRLAFSLETSGRGPNGVPLVLPEELRYEQLVWAVVPGIKTPEHVDEWLSMLEMMSPIQRTRALQDVTAAEDGAFALAEQIWRREADKPTEQRDWLGTLRLLDELAQWTRGADSNDSNDMEVLWASAVRAEIIIRAEYLEELADAVRQAEAALAQASADPRVHLLVRECVGRQYLYAGQMEEAIHWLSDALANATEAFPQVRMLALFSLSRAALTTNDSAAALENAQRGADLARTSEAISVMEAARALGELAITRWRVNGVAAAFPAWDEAAGQLLACRSETALWQDLCVIFSHISGYFTAVASTGEPPTLSAGNEPYTAPTPGMLLNYRTDRAGLYQPDKDAILLAQLAMYAEAVGNDERAASWTARGLELARSDRQWLALSQLALSSLSPLTLADRYDDVLETALESGALTVALGTLRKAGKRPEATTGEYQEVLLSAFGPRPGPLWQQAEDLGLFLGVIPVTVRLATIALEDTARAQAAGGAVASLCREIATTAVNARAWGQVADGIEKTFIAEAPAQDLLDLAAQMRSDDTSGANVIFTLGASLRVRGNPRLALQIHQEIIPYLRRNFQNVPGLYRQVITPFVTTFWLSRLAERRVYFRMPNLITSQVSAALSEQSGDVAQQVLATVAQGLG